MRWPESFVRGFQVGVFFLLPNPSFGLSITASLVMPKSDPQDGFFYPTLTLMIDSYILIVCVERGDPFFCHFCSVLSTVAIMLL